MNNTNETNSTDEMNETKNIGNTNISVLDDEWVPVDYAPVTFPDDEEWGNGWHLPGTVNRVVSQEWKACEAFDKIDWSLCLDIMQDTDVIDIPLLQEDTFCAFKDIVFSGDSVIQLYRRDYCKKNSYIRISQRPIDLYFIGDFDVLAFTKSIRDITYGYLRTKDHISFSYLKETMGQWDRSYNFCLHLTRHKSIKELLHSFGSLNNQLVVYNGRYHLTKTAKRLVDLDFNIITEINKLTFDKVYSVSCLLEILPFGLSLWNDLIQHKLNNYDQPVCQNTLYALGLSDDFAVHSENTSLMYGELSDIIKSQEPQSIECVNRYDELKIILPPPIIIKDYKKDPFPSEGYEYYKPLWSIWNHRYRDDYILYSRALEGIQLKELKALVLYAISLLDFSDKIQADKDSYMTFLKAREVNTYTNISGNRFVL